MQEELFEGFRLSPQQERIWLLEQHDKNSTYCVQQALLLKGVLNVDGLIKALQQIVDRYEVLRTRFLLVEGMTIPVQVIEDHLSVTCALYDLSNAGEQQENLVRAFLDETRKRPFHQEQLAFSGFSLLRLSEQCHILLLTLSPLCADSVSMNVLLQEVVAFYQAVIFAEPQDESTPVQYVDFSEWYLELLEAEDIGFEKKYWKQHYSRESFVPGFSPEEVLEEQEPFFQPDVCSFSPGQALTKQVETLLEQCLVPASTFMLACWQVLLWCLAEHKQVLIGIEHPGRAHEVLYRACGPFAKHLPLLARLEQHETFQEVLHRTQETLSEFDKMQAYFTWEQVAEVSQSRDALVFCPVGFDFQDLATFPPTPDLAFSFYAYYSCTERFQLRLSCLKERNNYQFQFYYDAHLFPKAAIERLAERFMTVLDHVTRMRHIPIGRLEMVGPSEYTHLVAELNETENAYPTMLYVHQLFEEQVLRTPDCLVVTHDMQQLSYQELNLRANQLAWHLKAQGVGPEVMVGLYLHPSVEMFICLLAILKAGGAYIPLDPAYSSHRLSFILQETRMPIILTVKHMAEQLPVMPSLRIVQLDEEAAPIAMQRQENPATKMTSHNLAYVIYTSGSTGIPKGVMVNHRNIVHSTLARFAYYQDKVSHFLLLSSFAFDSSVAGIFWTLCQGGRLIVLDPDTLSDPAYIAAIIAEQSISHMLSIPSFYAHILATANIEQLTSLRAVIVAGEAMQQKLVQVHQSTIPDVALFNEYGPTECTVWSTVYDTCTFTSRSPVPIGRPIMRTQLYVLNEHLCLVPRGVAGELFIGGDGVARGYLSRPDTTAECFLPHPFSNLPGVRLYKTGDRVRYRADGTLEFLGRVDRQVKVRGYRIELGEIEHALSKHPLVQEVAVMVNETEHEGSTSKQLVAYVVMQQSEETSSGHLRDFLRETLTDYMIPALFISLPALPRASNGKVNYEALAAIDVAQRQQKRSFQPPQTQIEQILAAAWGQVLRVEQVSVNDNFFDLGGDSILSILIVAKVGQHGLRLTTRQMFQYQTIAQLAPMISVAHPMQYEQAAVVGEVPLTPIQRRFFMTSDPSGIHHANQAMLLETRRELDPKLLERALQQIVEHHDALRTRFNYKEGQWRQTVVPFTPVQLQQFDLSGLRNEEQRTALEACANDLQASLHITSGPLVKVALFHLGTHQPDRFLLIIHHLVVDAFSWQVLLEDLQAGYVQLEAGEDIRLSSKTTSFQEWAITLDSYAHSVELAKELAYWTSLLALPLPRVPVGIPEGLNTFASECTIVRQLDSARTTTLLQRVFAAYRAQINEVLLAALCLAMEPYCNARQLFIDLESHGRAEIFPALDLSRTIGWFTSVYPMVFAFNGDETLEEVLEAVKAQLDTVPAIGIGYDLLCSLPEHTPLRSRPQPQINFNYLGQLDHIVSDTSLFRLAQESSGDPYSKVGRRSYEIAITCSIVHGQLISIWNYSENRYHRSTIESIVDHFQQWLETYIARTKKVPEAFSSLSDE